MSTFHIYGSLAIFLLFFDKQDNAYESIDIEIGVHGPTFTQEIKTFLRDNNIHTAQYGSKILW